MGFPGCCTSTLPLGLHSQERPQLRRPISYNLFLFEGPSHGHCPILPSVCMQSICCLLLPPPVFVVLLFVATNSTSTQSRCCVLLQAPHRQLFAPSLTGIYIPQAPKHRNTETPSRNAAATKRISVVPNCDCHGSRGGAWMRNPKRRRSEMQRMKVRQRIAVLRAAR